MIPSYFKINFFVKRREYSTLGFNGIISKIWNGDVCRPSVPGLSGDARMSPPPPQSSLSPHSFYFHLVAWRSTPSPSSTTLSLSKSYKRKALNPNKLLFRKVHPCGAMTMKCTHSAVHAVWKWNITHLLQGKISVIIAFYPLYNIMHFSTVTPIIKVRVARGNLINEFIHIEIW